MLSLVMQGEVASQAQGVRDAEQESLLARASRGYRVALGADRAAPQQVQARPQGVRFRAYGAHVIREGSEVIVRYTVDVGKTVEVIIGRKLHHALIDELLLRGGAA